MSNPQVHTDWDPDSWVWSTSARAFTRPSTLEEFPGQVGNLPTAKSGTSGEPLVELPGQGSPYARCGEESVPYLCPKCDHMKKGKMNCRRATCPKCYTTWAWLTAKRAAGRILKARAIFDKELTNIDVRGRTRSIDQPIHVMISLPAGRHAGFYDNYPAERRRVYRLLKKAGMKGGLLIPHPWRLKCASCGGDIISKWTVDDENRKITIKSTRCVDCGSKAFEWIDGPHFHVVGYGWIEHTRAIEEATGYIIKNIGLLYNVGGCIWYQLTHAGIRAGRQTVTYFGLCALNKYKSPPAPRDVVRCPKCGAIMEPNRPGPYGKPPPGGAPWRSQWA